MKRLLIANRGEIARRVIRTASSMGIETVAVYSDADAHAPHVREATVAHHLGPSPARESYLDQAKVLAAAKTTGADAIHPGYGFLSENAAFAEAVVEAGLIWVGPPASAITAMGLKDAAKALMAKAGVPTTPGYLGEDQSAERLQTEADRITYPVLIKAVAGGGGKGMRKVERTEDFAAALASCRREAASSFGDDRVLLETYVQRPPPHRGAGVRRRPWERRAPLRARLLAATPPSEGDRRSAGARDDPRDARRSDGGGGYGGQGGGLRRRRHHRVHRRRLRRPSRRPHLVHGDEHAPAGGASGDGDDHRCRLGGMAAPHRPGRAAAAEAGRRSALNGGAMEARLYAENPQKKFLPSTGKLEHFVLPKPVGGVRVDSGVEAGGDVTPFYDPMIAKIIVHAPTREGAAQKLAEACAEVEVYPVKTNAGFLARCLTERDFIRGEVDTSFIETRLDALTGDGRPSAAVKALAASAFATLDSADDDHGPFSTLGGVLGFRLNGDPRAEMRLTVNGEIVTAPLIDADLDIDDGILIADDDEVVVFDGGDAFVFSRPNAAGAGGRGRGLYGRTDPLPHARPHRLPRRRGRHAGEQGPTDRHPGSHEDGARPHSAF